MIKVISGIFLFSVAAFLACFYLNVFSPSTTQYIKNIRVLKKAIPRQLDTVRMFDMIIVDGTVEGPDVLPTEWKFTHEQLAKVAIEALRQRFDERFPANSIDIRRLGDLCSFSTNPMALGWEFHLKPVKTGANQYALQTSLVEKRYPAAKKLSHRTWNEKPLSNEDIKALKPSPDSLDVLDSDTVYEATLEWPQSKAALIADIQDTIKSAPEIEERFSMMAPYADIINAQLISFHLRDLISTYRQAGQLKH